MSIESKAKELQSTIQNFLDQDPSLVLDNLFNAALLAISQKHSTSD